SSSHRRFQVDPFPRTSFYLRRAFRILPFWWLTIVAIGIAQKKAFKLILPSLLFYFGFIRFDAKYDINPQGWSLFAEECFYLLLPFIFVHISTLARAITFALCCIALHATWSIAAPRLGVPIDNDFVYLFPVNHWFCFAFGIVIYYCSRKENV